MRSEIMRLVLDKIETTQNKERIFVFEGDNDSYDVYEKDIPTEILKSLKVGVIIEAEIENGEMISPEILVDETNKKTEEMNTRLNNLFKRKKQGS